MFSSIIAIILCSIVAFDVVWRVAAPHYSVEFKDLLLRVWCNTDTSLNEIATVFDVPESTLRGWKNQVLEYGTIQTTKEIVGFETRGRDRIQDLDDICILLDCVAENPLLYYDELNDEYQRRGGSPVCDNTIRNTFTRLGVTRKQIWKYVCLSVML